MATTTTLHTYVNGQKHTQIRAIVIGDGTTQLSDEVIYDYSADTQLPADAAPAQIKIKRMWVTSPSTGVVTVDFHGTTNDKVITIPPSKISDISWDYFGGLRNSATAPTGDIVLNSTTALGDGEVLQVVLDIHKT